MEKILPPPLLERTRILLIAHEDSLHAAVCSRYDWIIEGVIGGAGSVFTFLPILLIFFATLALLEDVGYMARAAYRLALWAGW
jgi:Fe2+ transport system protein B